jgi:nucleotide-binding universal stress UspA family protein
MVALAAQTGGQITALAATADRSPKPLDLEDWLLRMQTCTESSSIPVYPARAAGRSSEAMVRYASDIEADLVGVRGCRGHLWRYGLPCSISSAIAGSSSTPVFVAGRRPALAGYSRSVRRQVICAVDLQNGSETLVRYGDRLAATLSAQLAIAYVMPEITEGSLAVTLADPHVVLSRTAAYQKLAALSSLCTVPAETHLLQGHSGSELSRLGANLGPSVMAVGRRDTLRLGSTAASLMRRSQYPFIVVPL